MRVIMTYFIEDFIENTNNASTKEEALSRINNQMDIEEKKVLSTYVCDNTKNLKSLQNEVERIKELLI